MLGDQARAVLVVGQDGRDARNAVGHGDDRQVGPVQTGDQGVVGGRNHDQPVDLAPREFREDLVHAEPVERVVDHQVLVPSLATTLKPGQHLGVKGVVRLEVPIAKVEAEDVGALLAECAGQNVRAVAQFVGGDLDSGSGGLADPRVGLGAVEDHRDRERTDVGPLGHVSQGRFLQCSVSLAHALTNGLVGF